MNVITEELRRQAALWRALTGGEAAAAQEETETDRRGRPPSPVGVREAGRPVREAAEPAGIFRRPGETEEAAAVVLRIRAAGTMAAADRRRSAVVDMAASAAGQVSGSPYFWEESPAAEPAQELSRLFERDARRYDGGFSLY